METDRPGSDAAPTQFEAKTVWTICNKQIFDIFVGSQDDSARAQPKKIEGLGIAERSSLCPRAQHEGIACGAPEGTAQVEAASTGISKIANPMSGAPCMPGRPSAGE